MTENEAIDLDKLIADAKALSQEKDTLARTFRGFRDYGNPKSTITSGAEKAQKEAEQYKQVAKLFEELKQYRTIGTVKQIMEMQFVTEQEHDEVLKYRAIGTVEEFKALKEKSVAKKPLLRLCGVCRRCCVDCDRYEDRCPTCRGGLYVESGKPHEHCPHCGQKLDWQ